MDKSIQKRAKHNPTAVALTAEKFGYTARYVRGCLKGDFKGPMPDEVIKTYRASVKTIEETINKLKTVKK